MNQIKTFKVLVIVLAIMNVSLLAIMWFHRPPMDGGHRERPNDMNRFLAHELNLSDAQQQQFDALFDEHQQKMEAVKNRGRELHDMLFDELSKTSSTTTRDSIIQLIAQNRINGEQLLFDHLVKVRAMCNEKQKQEFDRIIKGAMARLGERK
jgi:Spy/CpxP family protein refolding chaperone